MVVEELVVEGVVLVVVEELVEEVELEVVEELAVEGVLLVSVEEPVE